MTDDKMVLCLQKKTSAVLDGQQTRKRRDYLENYWSMNRKNKNFKGKQTSR